MSKLLLCLLPLPMGFLLDLLLGDPHWLYHPVRAIGALISALEHLLRRLLPATRRGELAGGVLLAAAVPLFSAAAALALLLLAARLHWGVWLALETLFTYQLLAAKSLRVESMAVYHPLSRGDLPAARICLSRIVGRDTAALASADVARAAVETVAENTTDGVVAPLCFLALGGAPFGFLYKAVNTLDSMVGYRNARYLYFGRASARLDDLFNFVPARLSALLMIAAAAICRQNPSAAWRIWRRDRRRHPSPNCAHTEAACAGALGVALGGNAHYSGVLHTKPVLGDPLRPLQPQDIPRSCRLMTACAWMALLLGTLARVLVAWAVLG